MREQVATGQEKTVSLDALTGLPNRAALLERLPLILEQAQQEECDVAVMKVGLVGCDAINLRRGRQMGDAVLERIAARLRAMFPDPEQLYRVGGVEFLLILRDVRELTQALFLSETLIVGIEQPVVVSGQRFSVSANIGVACSSWHGNRVAQLLDAAERALGDARRAGQGRCCICQPPRCAETSSGSLDAWTPGRQAALSSFPSPNQRLFKK